MYFLKPSGYHTTFVYFECQFSNQLMILVKNRILIGS